MSTRCIVAVLSLALLFASSPRLLRAVTIDLAVDLTDPNQLDIRSGPLGETAFVFLPVDPADSFPNTDEIILDADFESSQFLTLIGGPFSFIVSGFGFATELDPTLVAANDFAVSITFKDQTDSDIGGPIDLPVSSNSFQIAGINPASLLPGPSPLDLFGFDISISGPSNLFVDDTFQFSSTMLPAETIITPLFGEVEAGAIVPVDIKPGSDPNSVNLKSRGVLPVAILSSDNFDALEVDVDSVLFGDPILIADGGIAVSPLRSSQEDVNNDGLIDLSLFFSVPMMADDNGVLGDLTTEGRLTGSLLSGFAIAGSDAIRIVGRGARGVPEPSTLLIAAFGLLGLAYAPRRRG